MDVTTDTTTGEPQTVSPCNCKSRAVQDPCAISLACLQLRVFFAFDASFTKLRAPQTIHLLATMSFRGGASSFRPAKMLSKKRWPKTVTKMAHHSRQI